MATCLNFAGKHDLSLLIEKENQRVGNLNPGAELGSDISVIEKEFLPIIMSFGCNGSLLRLCSEQSDCKRLTQGTVSTIHQAARPRAALQLV